MDHLMDDDYDPLAPVHYGDVDDDPVGIDGGHADPDNIVRVWLTGGQLSRVQVSPVWHLKLREKSLETCFAAALAGANIRVADAPDHDDVDLSGVDFSGLPRFGRSAFATFRLAIDNFNRRWDEAVQRQQHAPVDLAAPVAAEADGVTVRLDDDGHAVAVEFEEDFLEDHGTKEISQGVLRVAQLAYTAFEQTPAPADELTLLAREHEILMAGLMSMLSGRDDR